MAEHAPLPWAICPQEYDDWGYVRGVDGSVACCARGEDSSTWDRHRENGTDPFQANADLIVKAVNNHNEAIGFLELASKSLWRLGDQAVAHEIDRFLGRVGGAGNPLPPSQKNPCSHQAIIGLDGCWHCQRCGDTIEMASAHSVGGCK